MKIYLKVIIALAAMSAGAVCYAGGLPAAKQNADSLAAFEPAVGPDAYNYWDYHDFRRWYRRHRQYDGKNMQLRFGAGMSSEIVSNNFNGYAWGYTGSYPYLYQYYNDYAGAMTSTGSYSMGFQYNLTRVFSVGVDASAEILWYNLYDSINRRKVGRVTGAALCFLPQVRLNYANRPLFRIYSSLSIGLVAYCGDYSDLRVPYGNIYTPYDGSVSLAWQFSPLGCEIGRTVFAFAEIGVGHLYSGVRGGIGYRF